MSLNMFWFLPTHGDGHYLWNGKKVHARLITAICNKQQAGDRLGYTGVLIPNGGDVV